MTAAPPGAEQDALWEIVAGSRHGILATIGADGMPQLSNVYYVADLTHRVVRISTMTARTKGRNLLRDPRAALHVPGRDFFNFAVAEGDVTLAVATDPGDPATDELYAVHAVFNGEEERPAFDHRVIADQRMIVRLTVTKVYGLVIEPR
jgi:PPOX class probable F420-dependent enzyme